MSRRRRFSRRRLLRRSAAAAAAVVGLPCLVRPTALSQAGRAAASDRIAVGCIGVGNQGRAVMQNFLAEKSCQVVAVCDVKSRELAYGRDLVDRRYGAAGCRAYGDFRELLAREDVDAVLIAVPDHWHVLVALAAARAGKDIYLEKPIGVSLAEAQALRAALRRHGTVFQFGTQQRSEAKFLLACELVRNGRVGRLREVNVWSPTSKAGGSTRPAPVPEGLDYDMWLGPAPWAPYTEHRCTNVFPGTSDPFKIWPYISDYCLGWISGWGVHPLDIALWGGGAALTGPMAVEGRGRYPTEGACDTAIDWSLAIRWPGGVVLNFKGTPSADAWRARYGTRSDHGTAFEGGDGWVHVDRGVIHADPPGILKSSFGAGDIRLYRSVNHVGNFLDCIRSRAETISSFESAMAADTLCQVSAAAARLARPVRWDDRTEQFIGDEQANRMLQRAMRSPWHL